MKPFFSLYLVLLFLFPFGTAAAAGPPTAPMLRLETGMHTATIKRMDIDRAERLLVTGSDDKTARLWDLQTGDLLRVFRLPIDVGDEGKVYAVAISPNGTTVAAGGWTGWDWDKKASIYLFDTTSGQMNGRLSGLGEVVLDLAFSPDGRYLAAALGKGGIRLWQKKGGGWQLAGEDRDYGGASYGLSFAPDRKHGLRLVSTCFDGDLRLYSLENGLNRLAMEKAGGGQRPYGVAFSPDGSRIAVGYDDSTAVTIHDGKSLAQRFAANTQGVDNGDLSKVAWSSDGALLHAGGRYQDDDGMNPICRWDRGGQGQRHELDSGVQNTIFDLHPLSNGRMGFVSGDPAWGILNRNGEREALHLPVIGDFRDMDYNDAFRLSDDGREFGFAYGGNDPATFSIPSLDFGSDTGLPPPEKRRVGH